MKRILIFLLLTAILLSGCAGRETAPAETPPPTPSPTPAPTPGPTPEPPETFPFDFSQELIDNELCALRVTAIGLDGEGNRVFHLQMENRSREIASFRFCYQSINGLAIEDFVYRVGVGETVERQFRVLRDALASFGAEEPAQWAFTLMLSSAESNREPWLSEELWVCPFGEEQAVRFEYRPGPEDRVVMDNAYATVYVTGVRPGDAGWEIDYAAVNHTDAPLLLVLPEREVWLNNKVVPVTLRDGLGGFATLFGYIPAEGETDGAQPEIELYLALSQPDGETAELLEDTVTQVILYP